MSLPLPKPHRPRDATTLWTAYVIASLLAIATPILGQYLMETYRSFHTRSLWNIGLATISVGFSWSALAVLWSVLKSNRSQSWTKVLTLAPITLLNAGTFLRALLLILRGN